MKFEVDLENELVFALYPVFETLSDSEMVGDEWQALDEGIALIRKPYPEDRNGYYELIRERVQIGADAYFVGAPVGRRTCFARLLTNRYVSIGINPCQ